MTIITSKTLWFFSGIWVLLGAAVSAAALLGGTVGDLLGLRDILTKLPLYDLAVIYRANSSLVHILAVLFLVAWLLQGFYTFLIQSKSKSGLFVGVNIILLPVWLYSFWSFINPFLVAVQILIVLSLGLSWVLYPWQELLREKILLNINKATDIVEKSNSIIQQKSHEIINALMEDGNKTVSNTFTAKARFFEKTCQDVLSEMNELEKRTKNTIKTSELEGLHVDSTLFLNKAHAIEKDDLLLKGDDECQKLIEHSLKEKNDEIINKIKTLHDKYTLSNLPDGLSDMHYGNSTFSIKDIIDQNQKFTKDTNNQSIDLSKLHLLVLQRISEIEEYIEKHMTKLTDFFNHLTEETEKLNTAAEVIDNENLRRIVDEICINPIKNKLAPSCLADYNKNLMFDEAEEYLKKIADEIEESNDNVDFIYTLVLMIEAKKLKSSTFTDVEKRQIESKNELVTKLKSVFENEYGIDMSNLLTIDPIKKPSNTEGFTEDVDYTNYLVNLEVVVPHLIRHKSGYVIINEYYFIIHKNFLIS